MNSTTRRFPTPVLTNEWYSLIINLVNAAINRLMIGVVEVAIGTFRNWVLLVVATLAAAPSMSGTDSATGWSYYCGSHSCDRYSALTQIDTSTVKQLHIVWQRPGLDSGLLQQFPDLYPSDYFRGTPIYVDGVLYAPDGVGLVEAFDGLTGKTIWVQQPAAPNMEEAAGVSTRGVDYWQSGKDKRIIVIRGDWLYALDAQTGIAKQGFGRNGRVFLRRKAREDTEFWGPNGAIVVNDVIVVSGAGGGNVGDAGFLKEATPEDVRGFDVRSGKLLWTFHVMPQPGDPARRTWGKGSASYAGNMGAWATMSADSELGYVYVPLSAVTNAVYGGHRPGDNLYSNCLVALDAKTGKLKWHFQLVHHDLWDFDTASPPVLGSVTVDGRRINAVFQANKSGYLYSFDRRTGRPIWPIVEQPVPASTVPGEQSSPTQPVPEKPPAFDRQGVTEADLMDFTPELHAQALAMAHRYHLGPVFAPPSIPTESERGTLTVPGVWGAGNWNTGAFDPDTGVYYAVSMTQPGVLAVERPQAKATIDYVWAAENGHWPEPEENFSEYGIGPSGLPLLKPPYGRITAFNMNQGTLQWMVPNGDGPRNHPLLRSLHLPPLGSIGRPAPLVTKTLLFLGESSNSLFGQAGAAGPSTFRAYDKNTGQVLAAVALPAGTTGAPMTYSASDHQLIVVPVGDKRLGGGWIALAADRTIDGARSSEETVGKDHVEQQSTEPFTASSRQVSSGAEVFGGICAKCHVGAASIGPALLGPAFWQRWAGKPVRKLYARILSTMPENHPGTLQPAQALDVTAFLAGSNNVLENKPQITRPDQLDGFLLSAPPQ